MDYKDFGNRVRDVRRRLHMTQEMLAEKLGVSPSFLGHIERGQRAASIETLVALCNALNVSPDYLLSASLDSYEYKMDDRLSPKERMKLTELLRFAEEAVKNWDD